MKQIFRKSTAILLVLVQLIVLCPFGMMQAQAAEAQAASAAVPALNKTIVGTVKFQSFNFLGDNATGSDGVDYTSTFYYSDDFFSPSAIHETSSANQKWSDLTASEMSLASMSFDFATAAYATNVGNVMTATDRTWDNTDYSDKAKNARDLLTTCGFENFEAYDYGHAPTNDSIAYVIASKKIHVWDETANANRDFTLIAVGVRGAGYGAEWASNVTIGNKNTNQLPTNGRHWGFDSAAAEICSAIQTYLSDHNITQEAKYWITGFSRAGATANLVAGYVTDGAATTYHTRQRDVYGYTWECPKAASTDENALNYKNIHNILNAMDAVPKVSPDAFEHQRLGVDFVMPYYGNTTSSQNNTAFYTNMREVLKTIAVGAYNYKGEYYTEDPLISVTDPQNYPYNRAMTIYTIKPTQLISDALNDRLAENFGTASVTGSDNKLGTNIYIDKFIDNLIDVFLKSKAWIGDIGGTRTPLQNRTTFISDYQSDFRNVLGYLLDYSGPAFLGMVDALIDAVGDQLSISNTATNAGLGLAFLNFYEYPTSTYKWGVPPFIDPWVGKPSWAGNTRRAVLISEAQPVVRNVVHNMVGSFSDPQGITQRAFDSSMDHLVQLIVNLYADELSKYNSNYFGTSLHYMWQILCTHEQEVVMSWIKSLDPNHINRGYRTLTVPKGTDVKMYLCRSGYGETLGFDTAAPLVAEVKNTALVPITDPTGKMVQTLDDRISVTESGENMVIRYPSLLDLRFDVTTDTAMSDLSFTLSDYRTNAMATALSDGEKQYDPARFTASNYTRFTSNGANNWNTLSNSSTIPLATNETLSITARHTSAYDENDTASNLFYNMRKHADTTRVIDFSAVTTVATDAQTLSGETNRNGQFQRNATAETVTYQLNHGAQLSSGNAVLGTRFADVDTASVTHSAIGRLTQDESLTAVPASSVYYDDDLVGQSFTSDGHGYSPDINDTAVSKSAGVVSGTFYFTFYGSGIDAYCTTDSESGYVSAAVFRGAGAEACVKANRVGSAQTVSNHTAGEAKYNTPTISFKDLGEQDTYTLKIAANDNAKFKLDGVRVYNPVQAGTAAAEAQAKAGEGNTLYVNLHEMLVNKGTDGFSVVKPENLNDDFDKATISGVLFVDNAENLATESHYYIGEGETTETWHDQAQTLYQTQFEAYKTNSPNNEIYLAKDQAITFQVNIAKAPVGSTIYIGLSAPETGSGRVTVTGNPAKDVTSVMDMYYGITVPTGGLITITNVGSSLISLTNLKITNVTEAKTISAMPASERLIAMRTFFAPVTTETVELAAQPAETAVPAETPTPTPAPTTTPAPTPEPTPNDQTPSQNLSQLISGFVQNLFSAFSRLFRP